MPTTKPDTVTRTITFSDGQTRTMQTSRTLHELGETPDVVGLDPDGRIIVSYAPGHTFGLTLCCNASDKGVEDGVVCRACYRTDDIGSYSPTVAATVTDITVA